MSPRHGPRRARVTFEGVAGRQIAAFDLQETIAADRAIVAIQTNPEIGDFIPGREPVREYREPGTGVRVIYYATTLGTHVVIAYIEV